MTTKKKTNKRTTRLVPAALRARARAIINSDAYDQDTRESIAYQLKTGYSGLADMVERAEQGETICDTFKVGADRGNAARRVIALFETKGVPDFVTDAMMDALEEASALENIPLWKPDGDAETFDAAAVSKLFSLAQMLSLKPSTPKDRVAAEKQRVVEATTELLNNPQTPGDLYEAIGEFIATASSQGAEPYFLHSAPVLSAMFQTVPEEELIGAVWAKRKEEK